MSLEGFGHRPCQITAIQGPIQTKCDRREYFTYLLVTLLVGISTPVKNTLDFIFDIWRKGEIVAPFATANPKSIQPYIGWESRL
ncbi:hypothetical protein PG993_011959 [Apiospora rasikravindrae]|uniref:Uncharacterized protein n=1 Tax=Apiospora rasikravindrae TaxID=990691 RepID=A0ABR1S181_9PEZI